MDPSGAGEESTIFREVQRFRQTWLWALVFITAVFAWFAFIYELFDSPSLSGQDSEIWLTALVWVLVGLGVPALIILCKLVIEVRRDGLYYRYHPFHRKTHHIARDEIKTSAARTYRPIVEYGGWGMRGAWKKGGGRAYNVYANRGLQLELVDGKRVLFGSQHADELAAAVRKIVEG